MDTVLVKASPTIQPCCCGGHAAGQFVFFLDTKKVACLGLGPLPVDNAHLLSNLAIALGIGVVANLVRSEPRTSAVILRSPLPTHPRWAGITDLFTRLSGIQLELDVPNAPLKAEAGPAGTVALVSGGKDTLFALEHAQQAVMDRPGVYLGAGCELNWVNEWPQARRVAQHFGIRLHHVQMQQIYVSSKEVLRFANRAVWRELATLSLARCLGDEIITGINCDAVARLEVTHPRSMDYLSQLMPTLQVMEQILQASINTVPGELEVYRQIRAHPLWDRSGSCLSACAPTSPCSKCRTWPIYDEVIEGRRLSAEDLAFIHSDRYMGDACLYSLATAIR